MRLQWETEKQSELKGAYSRWLPLSVRKSFPETLSTPFHVTVHSNFSSFLTMPHHFSSVKRDLSLSLYQQPSPLVLHQKKLSIFHHHFLLFLC